MDFEYMQQLLEEQKAEGFSIQDDRTADWAVQKVLEAVAERDRLLELVQAQMDELNEKKRAIMAKCDRKTAFLTDRLHDYFDTVKTRDTATTKNYELLSGKLVQKKQQPEYVRDNETLTNWAFANAPELVKSNPTINWGELKKRTRVEGEAVVLVETGEVVQGVVAKALPDVFEVKA